jgi:hypothetical protein
MSYSEISDLLRRYREVMDALYGVVVVDAKAVTAEEAVAKYRELFPPEPSMKARVLSSLDFVVDMMNGGGANPKDVYPSGRYHGD